MSPLSAFSSVPCELLWETHRRSGNSEGVQSERRSRLATRSPKWPWKDVAMHVADSPRAPLPPRFGGTYVAEVDVPTTPVTTYSLISLYHSLFQESCRRVDLASKVNDCALTVANALYRPSQVQEAEYSHSVKRPSEPRILSHEAHSVHRADLEFEVIYAMRLLLSFCRKTGATSIQQCELLQVFCGHPQFRLISSKPKSRVCIICLHSVLHSTASPASKVQVQRNRKSKPHPIKYGMLVHYGTTVSFSAKM